MERAKGTDSRALRDCFGRFATGVAIATCHPAGRPPKGITINSVSSVSLDPPLMLFCLDCQAAPVAEFLNAGHFAINILRQDQMALSNHFAAQRDFPDDLPIKAWESGAPVIESSLAVADCALHDVFGGGDHKIILGRVLQVAHASEGQPLIYFGGGYQQLNAR